MSDYIGNLAARALGLTVTARPRPSLFEPRRDAVETVPSADEPAPVERGAPRPSTPALRRHPGPEPPPEPDDRRVPEQAPRSERAEPTVRQGREKRDRDPVARRAGVEGLPPVRPRGRRAAPLQPPPPDPVEPSADVRADPRPSRRVRAERPPALLAAKPPRPAVRAKAGEPPTVRVTIGRVDVRAVTPEKPRAPKPKPRPTPRMSLDEYLSRERSNAR